MDGVDKIKILPPRPGACKICAGFHARNEPHDTDSLYYINRFYKKHGRFPTAEDAARHAQGGALPAPADRLPAGGKA